METVRVQCSVDSAHVTFSVEGHGSITVGKDQIGRSTVLSTVVAGGDDTSSSFIVHPGYLQAWLKLVQGGETQRLEFQDTKNLLLLLKAADYLADEVGVQYMCQELGRRLVRQRPDGANAHETFNGVHSLYAYDSVPESDNEAISNQNSSPDTPDTVQETTELILGELPAHLAISIIQSADMSLFKCVETLPEAYHTLALCAHVPAITQNHACHIESDPPHHPPPSATDLQALFTAIATFTKLQELHVGIVGLLPDAYGPLARSFEHALSECRQLQSISIIADHRSQGFLTAQTAPALTRSLPRLANLTRVKLHACAEFVAGATDEYRIPGSVRSASFRDLLVAVCQCKALEELCLTMMLMHEGVASDRDYFLASNLSSLPSTLRVLKLRSSVTGDCLRALDVRLSDTVGVAGGHGGAVSWLPNLRELDVGHSYLGDHGMNALVQVLNRLRTLEVLNISENEITHSGAQTLAPVLANLTSLRQIDVRDNRLEDTGLVALCSAWDSLQHLQHVDVSYCDVSIDGSVVFARTLASLTNLQHLHMKGCKLTMRLWEEDSRVGDCVGAGALAEALSRHSNLRSLSLVNTLLKSEAMALLAPSLALHTMLTSLDLHFNIGFGSLGVESLSRSLQTLGALRCLRMSCFDVSRGASAQFAQVLSALTKLQKLGLLGFHTARSLMRGGPRTPLALEGYLVGTLVDGMRTGAGAVNLQRAEGANSSIEALVAALGSLKNLEELQVMSCGLTAACAPMLAESIQGMSSLHTLQMDNNPLRDDGVDALVPALRRLVRMRWLTMASTDLTLRGAVAIVAAVEGHRTIERCSVSVMETPNRLEWPEMLRRPWVSIF